MHDQPQHPTPQPPYTPAPGYLPPPPPPPVKAPKRRVGLVLAVAASVVAGIAIGSAATGSAEPTTKTETVTETETVEVAPQSCLDALDAAEGLVHRGVVPAFDASADAMDAASRFDVAGINAATARMNRLTPRIERYVGDYNAAADSCRSAS